MFKAQYYRLMVKHSLRASNANDFLHEAIALSLSSAEQCVHDLMASCCVPFVISTIKEAVKPGHEPV